MMCPHILTSTHTSPPKQPVSWLVMLENQDRAVGRPVLSCWSIPLEAPLLLSHCGELTRVRAQHSWGQVWVCVSLPTLPRGRS